ncbi:hypothetical protein F5887DRAFT_1073537 [Amanita rubescens]|nr:hypothetical protein F5887DRAFT_1073537 [Amanita rubescens]
MAAPNSFLTLAEKIWTGRENIADLKVYLDFITSLPINIKQYRNRFALNEAIIPAISDDRDLDSILELHSGISTRWKAFSETTFVGVKECIRSLQGYTAQGDEFHQTIKASLQLLGSASFQKSRPQLASIISDTISGETAKLQQHLDTVDQLIHKIGEFGKDKGRNIPIQTPSVQVTFKLSSNVKELKLWVASVNRLPLLVRSRVLENSTKKTWVPFVGLVFLNILENSAVVPFCEAIKECLKSDEDSNMAADKLRLHTTLVEETLREMGVVSLTRTVGLLENIKALYLCIKQSLDAVQENLARITTSADTSANLEFNPQKDAFREISERAQNFLTCFSEDAFSFYNFPTSSAIENKRMDG